MPPLRATLDSLANLAHADGGWGYTPDQPPQLEPTCFGLLALSLEPQDYSEVRDRARSVLAKCAVGDGTYRLERGRPEAAWPTALVLFTLRTLGASVEETALTVRALLDLKGRLPVKRDEDADYEIHDIDVNLVGWPWAENNFSWVEPTAWACLALRRAGCGQHERVQQGQRLLLDRTFDTGGANYGNRHVLGRALEPVPGPTAITLLALQGQDDQPRVQSSVRFLMQPEVLGEDLDHLCWARLALTAYRHHAGVVQFLGQLDERIAQAQSARTTIPYLRISPFQVALTALAQGAERACPFVLGNVPDNVAVNAPRVTRKRASLGERFRSAVENLAATAVSALRQVPPRTRVHIARTTEYTNDLSAILGRQYELFREQVPLRGKRVVLKPNLVEYHPDKVINTDPRFIGAVIELCQREGAASITVAEGPGHRRNVEFLVAETGLGAILQKYNVPFVDINHDEPVKRHNLGRLTGLQHLYLSRTVDAAEVLISLPKLKTHHWAVATLSLKNLFGILPGTCYGWPKNELHWRGIDRSIVDIALTRTPELAIVDGIVGMEGDGPLNGTPRALGAVVMGTDLVAVDATCCRLMQLNPEKVPYLILAAAKKLGLLAEPQIEQMGESIGELAQPFETLDSFRHAWQGRSA